MKTIKILNNKRIESCYDCPFLDFLYTPYKSCTKIGHIFDSTDFSDLHNIVYSGCQLNNIDENIEENEDEL